MVSRVATALIFVMAMMLGACASSAKDTRVDAQNDDVAPDPKILYDAILDVYGERSLAVDLASEERLLVSSEFNQLNTELRRRYISRVIPFPKGVALNVTAEYQRRDRTGDEPRWAAAEDEYTRRRAKNDEQSLGKEIKQRFRALKDEQG